MISLSKSIGVLGLYLTIFCFCASHLHAEVFPKTGMFTPNKWYAMWGYNRSFYTKSDLHISGDGYDVRLDNITAHDRQSPVSNLNTYINPILFSIPQFGARIGHFFTPHISVSGGMDHMKYVMDQEQIANVTGTISEQRSGYYKGIYNNTPVQLTKDFLRFEHTNGLNYFYADINLHQVLITNRKGNLGASANLGAGGGFLTPRTDIRVLNGNTHNQYHLSGAGFHVSTELRIHLPLRLFFSYNVKGGYMTLPKVLVKGLEGGDQADHNFGWIERTGSLGWTFGNKMTPSIPKSKEK